MNRSQKKAVAEFFRTFPDQQSVRVSQDGTCFYSRGIEHASAHDKQNGFEPHLHVDRDGELVEANPANKRRISLLKSFSRERGRQMESGKEAVSTAEGPGESGANKEAVSATGGSVESGANKEAVSATGGSVESGAIEVDSKENSAAPEEGRRKSKGKVAPSKNSTTTKPSIK